jgi:hypothetical protein
MSQGEFFFDKVPVEDFASLLRHYGQGQFTSPFRSTVPLLCGVRDGWDVFRDVLFHCDLPENSNLQFEYTQAVTRGRGKASHTDLMVCSGEHSLEIEAKWTEPRYETVAEWLASGKIKYRTEARPKLEKTNREEVMAGWHALLQSRIPDLAPVGNFSNTVYQMVHRAASACGRSAQPQLAYLRFKSPSENCSGTYWADLCQLHELLGSPRNFRFHLIEIDVAPTSAFDAIKDLEKGSNATGAAVLSSLLNSTLFEFGPPTIRSL